jgi:hypothetical protein
MNTLGDVITIGLIVAALAIVPYKLIKAHFGSQIGRAWVSFVSVFSMSAADPSVKLSSQTDRQTTQTDQQTARLSAIPLERRRLALDKTRAAVLEELLTCGWTITDLRRENILRGDNDTISKEVAETRKRLGLSDPDRTIKVRDERGERVIPA